MSNLNYQSLLQYLDISHYQFIFLLIIIFFISSIIYFIYKIGLFHLIRFKQSQLSQCKLVYQSYQGQYNNIHTAFNQTINDINTVFKMSDIFGMYYDNPQEIQNQDQSRAVIGTIVHKDEQDKIKLFITKYPHYKIKDLTQKTKYIGTTYPYFNSLSIFMVIFRVYPRLAQQVKKRNIQKSIGVMEIYKIQHKNPHIQILLPINNLDSLNLWYKSQKKFNNQNKQQKKQLIKDVQSKKQK